MDQVKEMIEGNLDSGTMLAIIGFGILVFILVVVATAVLGHPLL